MSIAFYDASVMSHLQALRAVAHFMAVGLKFCTDQNIDPEVIVESRVHADMLPFRFQIQSVAHHSIGAMNGFASGNFRPPHDLPAANYQELQALIDNALETLSKLTPEVVNDYGNREIVFDLGARQLTFSAISFLISFSLPNLYFHATTAYDILRAKGVPLGKRDYLGTMRFN